MTRIAPDSAAARRSEVVPCDRAPYPPPGGDGTGIGAPGRDQRIPDHGADGDGDRLGVNGAPRDDFRRVMVAAQVQRPVAVDTGLPPPLHLADIGQCGGPVLAGQQVTGLPEHRGDRGEQLAVA
jgi:hypothetical protein